ncbi:fumarylacetoacetate hydrolase family protein [Enhydrobacter sp.]|jgi:2-keto-4-pentenoate hydratase/2-oxohepta-3-ene-1,7-dioic acid hydratase in catechol pathway|uniref:fumarylacetoacetate hydrolase family protein n=1 Tax=Enhydrobacter sp. TaxID=1894999 RepID=UPI002607E70D|nr:fumarylacetoacetate hydrolase family protein [Enhydrobacter sp.]WIM11492.1 MAG: Fumarylacetoacetate hydrolase family protein [Enhydrobacter sp.]
MRLASFRHAGVQRFGAVVEEGIVDLSTRFEGRWATLRDALADNGLADLSAAARNHKADFTLDAVELLPVVPNPDKILCIGLNYASHVGEVGRERPAQPSVFSRLHSTLVASGGDIVRPSASIAFDFEGELAVVIGQRCRHVPRAQALSVIAGYTCFLDASVRDFQKHSVTAGKNFPATGPLGPWLVTADVIPDPQALTLTTRLNGTVVQHDTTDHMIFDVATIIEYLSTVTWLEPGDIIATGTPEGVGLGRTPPLWMKAGDKVEVEISGIGTLNVNVVDE